MSDISLIDISKYQCYYSIDTIGDFKIYIPTPGGNIEYLNYDFFTSEDKTIIAFKELDPYSGDFNYILSMNNEETILNALCYDDSLEFLYRDAIKEDDWFTICKSITTSSNTPDHDSVKNRDRCDVGKYGPFKIILEDGLSPTDRDSEVFKQTNKLVVLLNAAGSGYIVWGRNPIIGTSFRDWPAVGCFSKTMMGMMKLIVEWASLAESPFDDASEISMVCKNFITALKIPENVINEISNQQEDMPVYRYIKGESDARHGFDEQPNIGPLFMNWIKNTHRHRTLSSLVANHSSPPFVPEEILLKEKLDIESQIYKLCIKYNFDESLSSEEILKNIPKPTGLQHLEYTKEIGYVKSHIAYS